MRIAIMTLLSCINTPAFGTGCDGMEDSDAMYNRFFQIAYELGSVNEKPAYVTRTPSKSEAIEGWECIEKATSLGNCSAIHIQELYYRHGVGKEKFNIIKNIPRADSYLILKEKHCANNTQSKN